MAQKRTCRWEFWPGCSYGEGSRGIEGSGVAGIGGWGELVWRAANLFDLSYRRRGSIVVCRRQGGNRLTHGMNVLDAQISAEMNSFLLS